MGHWNIGNYCCFPTITKGSPLIFFFCWFVFYVNFQTGYLWDNL